MESIETGGPAYPNQPGDDGYSSSGMTLRDYFAAAAMPALIARGWIGEDPDTPIQYGDFPNAGVKEESYFGPDDLAKAAYAFADAMIAARK